MAQVSQHPQRIASAIETFILCRRYVRRLSQHPQRIASAIETATGICLNEILSSQHPQRIASAIETINHQELALTCGQVSIPKESPLRLKRTEARHPRKRPWSASPKNRLCD